MTYVYAKYLWSTRGFYDYFAEFEYTENRPIGPTGVDKLIICIQGLKLELQWEVEYFVSRDSFNTHNLEWRNITLKNSEVEFLRGEFNINNKLRCAFDSDSLPFKKNLTDISQTSSLFTPAINIIFRMTYKPKNDDFFIFDYYKPEELASVVKYEEISAHRVVMSKNKQFLENKKLSDVTFVVEDKEIPAHKVIMAAYSDVFANMFTLEMLEKNSDKIKIEGIELKIFLFLLKFIYCQELEYDNTDELLKLMVAADRYSVQHLYYLIETNIATKLSIDNVVDILIVADLTNSRFLKYKCLVFINHKKHEVIKTESFKNMVKSGHTDLLAELYCLPERFIETLKITDKK